MTHPNPSTALARAVIDELALGGVGLVVVSPGSRSAALAIAADEHPAIETVTSIDERSAGFHAVGWAKATGSPGAVVSTSGTAPANYLPAVIEAAMSMTPLVVLSADRPEELRGVGANQAIDQMELFGGHVRSFAHIEAPDAVTDANSGWRAQVARAVAVCKGAAGPPGPVHLNIAFREPTVPVTDDGRTAGEEYPFDTPGRAGPWVDDAIAEPPPPGPLGPTPRRGLVIAGEGTYDRSRLRAAADRLGWPILATALSGMRGNGVMSGYHHLLVDGVPEALRPEMVYAVGAIGPSQRLEGLVSSAEVRVRIDYWGRHIDPTRSATHLLHADPAATLEAAASGGGGREEWAESWLGADEMVRLALGHHLDREDGMSGAAAARTLNSVSWDRLVAASSLPIREVDAHVHRPGTVIANRGASGIDGFMSTALGAARAGPQTLAFAGDLSLLHDSSGFLIDRPPDLVVVVLDNDGGGLFDSLPTARHAPGYERLFVTPHGRDLSRLAAFHGLGFLESGSPRALAEAIARGADEGGVTLIRVPVDRMEDLLVRESLDRVGAEIASRLHS